MSITTAALSHRAGAAPSPADRIGRFFRTPKGLLLALFAPLLAIAGTATGWGAVLPHLEFAIAGAYLMEVLASYVRRADWRWSTSPLISALIVGLVLDPVTPRSVTLLVAALAVASKHVFRTRRGHLFNPAALALLVSVPVFATGQSWWGALPDLAWPWLFVLLVVGAVIVERVDKFPLVLTFGGMYFGLLTFAALVNPAKVAELFRPPFVNAALFLAFFMLTDPPTAPGRYVEQVWVGGLVAITACLAQLLGVGQTYLLVALVVGNLAMVLSRSLGRRGGRAAASGGSNGAQTRIGGHMPATGIDETRRQELSHSGGGER
jgi:Na+-translocating ferredoxin:NAD+ oxidoreductase RnfD subunit